MSDKRTAIIDGDMIVYRSAFASEQEVKWEDDIWTLHSCEADMKVIIDETIDSIVDLTKCEEYMVVVSDSRNFRYNIFPDYKANRKTKRKPLERFLSEILIVYRYQVRVFFLQLRLP